MAGRWMVVLLLAVLWPAVVWAGDGIEIRPDDEGRFVYEDDFQTPRFLNDGFVRNFRAFMWQAGRIQNHGPYGWSLVYRFYGQRVIEGVEIRIEQAANNHNLGGYDRIFVSPNGMDWHEVASSTSLEPDRHQWQEGPLTVNSEQAVAVLGGSELWVKLEQANRSGLSTRVSSSISDLRIALTLGGEAAAAADPQADLRKRWGKLRAGSGWQSIALDAMDPEGHRPPHYFEDSDGWLRLPGEQVHFRADDGHGFFVQRSETSHYRLPLSLVTFVHCEDGSQPMMARVTVAAGVEATRQMQVLWNGQVAGEFDTARYLEQELTHFVSLPAGENGFNELRIQGMDGRGVRVRQIAIAENGRAGARWTTKPALPADGSLKVESSYYMPDPKPPAASQVVEGRNKEVALGQSLGGLQRMYEEHADFGGLRVVLRNDGEVPVRIDDRLELNGRPIEEHYVDFAKSAWDARGVVWYRIRPQLVEPGECAQVYIRFRRRPEGESATVQVHLENGEPVSVTVPYTDPGAVIDYITVDEAGDTLYVYVRPSGDNPAGKVTGVSLDGRAMRQAKIFGGDFPGNVALMTARLRRPLETGEFHVVGVETDRGMLAAQFRVVPWMFPRSSVHVDGKVAQQLHMNLGTWFVRSLAQCDKYDIDSSTFSAFRYHRRVKYVFGPDEPDARDHRGGGTHYEGLGWHARKIVESGRTQLLRRFAPQAAYWIIMNGTTRPLNWGVYGQMADIACYDPYPVTYFAADHAYVRESLIHAQKCGRPNRLHGCMETFGWRKSLGVPEGARGPVPAEYRQNIVQGIGSGMKGMTSWVYTANAGGWSNNAEFAAEIGRVNQLIEHIEDELLLATPIDLASSDGGEVMTGVTTTDGKVTEVWPKQRVWAAALLAGPDTLVVTAVNHIQASKPKLPEIEPARDVTVTVELPPYLQKVKAFEVTDDGVSPFESRTEDGKALLRLEAIESGRVFLLRRAK